MEENLSASARTAAYLLMPIALLLLPRAAMAQIGGNAVRIGVLGDMSGPNADQQGPGDVVAAKLAVADFGGKVRGAPIEVLSGDLLGKTDVGVGIARRWFDEGVDAIFSLGNSSVAIAVQGLAAEKNRITIATSAGSNALTNKACSPVSLHWTYDTYALPAALATAIVARGGKDWYFLTIDYAFGHALKDQATKFVLASGGSVKGETPHPPGETDFAASLTKAAQSGATVLGLATSGAPMMNALKQFQEFGLNKTMRPAALLTDVTDIRALGLPATQGLLFVAAYYWDQNDETRAFAERFRKIHGAMPTMFQASVYGAVMHYLKAVQATGTDNSDAVMKKMKETEINDFFAKGGRIREDGRMIHDMYLAEVKKPSESQGEWDLMKIKRVIPRDQAFQPLSESTCPLVKR